MAEGETTADAALGCAFGVVKYGIPALVGAVVGSFLGLAMLRWSVAGMGAAGGGDGMDGVFEIGVPLFVGGGSFLGSACMVISVLACSHLWVRSNPAPPYTGDLARTAEQARGHFDRRGGNSERIEPGDDRRRVEGE